MPHPPSITEAAVAVLPVTAEVTVTLTFRLPGVAKECIPNTSYSLQPYRRLKDPAYRLVAVTPIYNGGEVTHLSTCQIEVF